MTEVSVAHGNRPNSFIEQVNIERLLLAGGIDMAWDGQYPLPLFALDGINESLVEVSVNSIKYNRFYGFRPAPFHYQTGDLIRDDWDPVIDLPKGQTTGEADVLLTDGIKTAGYVFEQTEPYIIGNQLAYVEDPDELVTLRHASFDGSEYHLVYALAETIDQLGRLAIT
ncbi:MAG TPA: hypothetical protein VLF39_00120 [Candidatus Saccharimonadales bacterium]|nr:hypothetical protein [Candidatus Saccharimonadales bacterium]